jgi:hypothetical protein
LVKVHETLDGIVELLVKLLLLVFSLKSLNILRFSLEVGITSWWSLNSVVDALDSGVGLKISVDLRFDLSEIFVNILVSFFESLLSEFSYLAFHHAFLVFEKAIGSTEEAIKGDDFLEETKLGVSFVLSLGRFLRFDSLFNCGVNLSIDLLS